MNSQKIEQLRRDILAYADRRGGKIYAPLCHPEFNNIPYQHGHERFHIIEAHINKDLTTALDIGSHWGYFPHCLEAVGFKVVAVENMEEYLQFLYRFRDLYEDNFEIWPNSVFEMSGQIKYDVVLALNVFHHFLKKEDDFMKLKDLMSRIDCKQLFAQFHSTGEGQMNKAYKNFNAEEFCDFLIESSSLSKARCVGRIDKRPIYLLEQ